MVIMDDREVVRKKAKVDDSGLASGNREVDCEKATVEDKPGHDINGSNEVDREKAVVKDNPASGINGQDVDRNKATVEDNPGTSTHGQDVDRNKATVEDKPGASTHGQDVDRNKATVEDNLGTSTRGQDVDCNKATVEDKPGTSTYGQDVDRNKATVEDNPPKNGQAHCHKLGSDSDCDINNPDRVAKILGRSCKIVDQEDSTVKDEHRKPPKWTVRFHIQDIPDEALVKGLSTIGKLYAWKKPIIFGRGDDVDVFLNDERASRNHLELTGKILPNTQACFTIRNLSSTKGFQLNNREITANDQSIVLNTGDQITVACLSFHVEIVPGQDMHNFTLQFARPCDGLRNAGISKDFSSGVLLRSPLVPVPSAYQGHVYAPGAAGVIDVHRLPVTSQVQDPYVLPAGVLRAETGALFTGVQGTAHWPNGAGMPTQQPGSVFFPQGNSGATDRLPVFNLSNRPVPANPPLHHPVQEIESPEQKSDRKAVVKQPSENNEDSSGETTGTPLQDTHPPKDVD